MPPRKAIRGRLLKVDAPGTVQLADGTRLQMYKHYWTRGYLHLSEDGRAFVFVPKTRYEEVNPPWLLMRVLRQQVDPDSRYSVRQKQISW